MTSPGHTPAATRVWRGMLIPLTLSVFVLAVMPAPPREVDTGWDKLNHSLAFATLFFAGAFAWGPATRHARMKPGWIVAISAMAFGGLIELVQAFVPGRSSEFADLTADAVGVAIGSLLVWGVRRVLGTRTR